MGDDSAPALPGLLPLHESADWIRDPDDSSKRLVISPHGETVYVAESELSPPHREPLVLDASDLALYRIDWRMLLPSMAKALGFIPLPAVEGAGQVKRVGFVQRSGVVTHVHVFLPAGTPFDATALLSELTSVRDGILYVPTARWLTAEMVTLCGRQNLELHVLASHFAVTPDERGSLTTPRAKQAREAKTLRAMLEVQPDWTWENLAIRLTDNGTLVATYGRHRRQHHFERRGTNFSKTFGTFARLAWQGEWANPRSGHREHERLRKRFNRLRQALKQLIPIPGDPFRLGDGVWKPVFDLTMDPELQALLTGYAHDAGSSGPEDDSENE